jgi:hypothetical protein
VPFSPLDDLLQILTDLCSVDHSFWKINVPSSSQEIRKNIKKLGIYCHVPEADVYALCPNNCNHPPILAVPCGRRVADATMEAEELRTKISELQRSPEQYVDESAMLTSEIYELLLISDDEQSQRLLDLRDSYKRAEDKCFEIRQTLDASQSRLSMLEKLYFTAPVRQCPDCKTDLFKADSSKYPLRRFFHYSLNDLLDYMESSSAFVSEHESFVKNVLAAPVEPFYRNIDDYWKSERGLKLRAAGLVGKPRQYAFSMCPDGVTPGKRSRFSFWCFALQNLTLRPEVRNHEHHILCHALVEGSINTEQAKAIVDILVDDFIANSASKDRSAVLALVAPDHQAMKKCTLASGSGSYDGCEQCTMVGQRVCVNSSGSVQHDSGRTVYYNYTRYEGSNSTLRTTGKFDHCFAVISLHVQQT